MRVFVLAVLAGLALANLAAAELGPAPAWELNDLQGEPHRLEEWRGKWALLKLGRTDCPNCALEIHELAKIKDRLGEMGVDVIDIYLREDRYNVKKYWQKKDSDYQPTVLYDWKGGLIRSYGVSIIPRLFLVDKDGVIVWEGGYTPAPELLAILESHIQPAAKQ
jgi:alkyl hydroperoxide reductase subunit AhpC